MKVQKLRQRKLNYVYQQNQIELAYSNHRRRVRKPKWNLRLSDDNGDSTMTYKGCSRKSIIFGFRSVNTINKTQKIKWIFIIIFLPPCMARHGLAWHRIAGPYRIASICNAHQISVVVVFLSRHDDVDCLLFFVWSSTVLSFFSSIDMVVVCWCSSMFCSVLWQWENM